MDTNETTSGIPETLCACGCGEVPEIAGYTHKERGIVAGKRREYKRGHDRLQAFVQSLDGYPSLDECWIDHSGREMLHDEYKRPTTVLRAVYQYVNRTRLAKALVSVSIQPGCFRECVNPDHYIFTSRQEGTRMRAAQNPRPLYSRSERCEGRRKDSQK